MDALEIKTQTRVEQFEQLYLSAFPSVCRFVKTMGGTLDDARDVFQDGLVVLYEKNRSDKQAILVNEKAYLLGICKHLWYQKHRQQRKLVSIENFPEAEISINGQTTVSSALLHYLERSGKKCMELLKAFYYDNLSMKELATRFGFSGERSATAQKYKCLEKVRNSIKEQSLKKEDFYE